jgi:hypothetical protein
VVAANAGVSADKTTIPAEIILFTMDAAMVGSSMRNHP